MKNIQTQKFHKIFFIFLFLVSANVYSGNGFDTTLARILQQRIEYMKTAYNLVGISAAADVPGQGVWLGTAGISHVNVNMDTGMVFDIGSITKNFVAALTLQLIEADSLSLTDSIGTWLPQYPNVNNRVTIKQLLNHTSGIYNFTDNPAWANAINSDPSRFWTLEEVVQGYILAPYFAPGAGWRYSNTNYTLLTMIIREITGSDFPALFRSRFFTPLGMNEAFVEMGDTITAPFAHNWVQSGSQLIDAYGYPRTAFTSSAYGPGGVITRPENMLKWLKALYGGQIISNSMLDTMLTFVNANISGANGYGLGTMRYNVNGKICWGHAGNSFGHSSVAMYYPVQGITISVMMNKDINTGSIAIDFMNTVISNNPIGIEPISTITPGKFSLEQNYPNPFNPETNIRFSIPERSFVKIKIFDVTGKQVELLLNENVNAGTYEVKWNASMKPSGVYFYRIEAGNFSKTRKMIVIK
jgi:D-alanyl-D-alanine carboxypeptidase